MTACYAKDRKTALDKLGRNYDCCCHPEIMNAFVYGLNDTDERVRREAADEIGDQVRRNRCCCSPCVVSALTCSLADCDRWVRREATQALRACGYDVVDGCCSGCCNTDAAKQDVEAMVAEAMAAVQHRFQHLPQLSHSQPHLLRKQCLLQPHRLTHRHSSLHDCTTISQRRAAWLACLEWYDSLVDLRWERTASCSVTSSL